MMWSMAYAIECQSFDGGLYNASISARCDSTIFISSSFVRAERSIGLVFSVFFVSSKINPLFGAVSTFFVRWFGLNLTITLL